MNRQISMWVVLLIVALAIFIAGYCVGTLAYAQVVVVDNGQVLATNEALDDAPLSSTTVAILIQQAAAKYGVDFDKLYRTLKCESIDFNTNAIGDHGTSFGVAQIHITPKVHPEVTREQAMDGRWAIEWAASNFKLHATWWSCYNDIFE